MMKYFKTRISVIVLIVLCLISFGAFKSTCHSNKKINGIEKDSLDSLQILVDKFMRINAALEAAQRKSKMESNVNDPLRLSLLKDLRNYASKINGSREFVFHNVKYQLFVVNLDSEDIRLHLFYNKTKDNLLSLAAVKKQLELGGLFPLMITNAGMFTKDLEPEGLYVERNAKTFFALDTGTKADANFYLKPNGVFYIDSIPHIDTTEKLTRLKNEELQQLKLATQSGPMLVINGNIHKAFIPGSTNLKIRSGVGLIKGNNKKIVFAITRDESNFYDFALFFHDVFNCNSALFLDGAISQMYSYDLSPNELGGNFGPMISVTRKER